DMADRLRDAVVPDADLVVVPEVEVIALPAHLRRRRLDRPGDRSAEVDVEMTIVAPEREIRARPGPLRAATLSDLLDPSALQVIDGEHELLFVTGDRRARRNHR